MTGNQYIGSRLRLHDNAVSVTQRNVMSSRFNTRLTVYLL